MANDLTVRFPNQSAMAQAARTLLVCHPHHFDVRPDWGNALKGLSPMALECLRAASLEVTDKTPDREPQPGDGPEYHHDHAAWLQRTSAYRRLHGSNLYDGRWPDE